MPSDQTYVIVLQPAEGPRSVYIGAGGDRTSWRVKQNGDTIGQFKGCKGTFDMTQTATATTVAGHCTAIPFSVPTSLMLNIVGSLVFFLACALMIWGMSFVYKSHDSSTERILNV